MKVFSGRVLTLLPEFFLSALEADPDCSLSKIDFGFLLEKFSSLSMKSFLLFEDLIHSVGMTFVLPFQLYLQL